MKKNSINSKTFNHYLLTILISLLSIGTFAQSEIFGVTNLGGAGQGTMFQFDTSAAPTQSRFHNFTFSTGINPQGSLTNVSGKLYGMARTAGALGVDSGVIFSYDLRSFVYTDLYNFSKPNGIHPSGSLLNINGTLYGMTHDGGANGLGVIFKYNIASATYTTLYDFQLATGCNPYGSLNIYNGHLYGMTNLGGAKDSGVIFSFDTATNTYTDEIDLGMSTGGRPYGSILITPSGNFLALTYVGGTHDSGTVMLYDPIGNTVTDEYDFDKTSGGKPAGDLILAGSKLYGLTTMGGLHDSGTIFSIDPATYAYTDLFNFTKPNGTIPEGTLYMVDNGDLYGLTSKGGTNNGGVIFRMDTTTYTFTKLINFGGANGRGPVFTQLIEACTPPLITFQAKNAAVCENGDTSFTISASASGTIYYKWEVNTGSGFATIVNGGVYGGATTRTLSITGATISMNGYIYRCVTTAGCIDSTLSNNYTLIVDPTVAVNVTGNVNGGFNICIGMKDTLMTNVTGGTSPFNYSWNTSQTTDSIIVSAGITYKVIVTDKYGCKDSNTATVIVHSLPIVSAISSASKDTVCRSAMITLSGNGASTYVWNNGITDATPFPATIAGKYIVTGTDANGCSNKDSITLYIDTVKVSLHGNVVGNFTVCPGANDTITATTTSGFGKLGYAWSTSGTNDSIIVNSAGTYSVQVTDAYGCMGDAGATVNLASSPVITITSTPANDTVCIGSSITLSGNGAVSYSWSGGITNGVAFTPSSSGQYIVTGTDASGCTGKDSITVGVRTPPAITITSSSANDTVCRNTMVTLNGNGAVSYTWNNSITDGTPFAAITPGYYVVTGTDTYGCMNKDSIMLAVDTPMVSLHGNTIGNFTICNGINDTIAATSSGFGSLTYAWSTSGTNDTIIVSTPGSYSVQVTDAYGCMGNANANVISGSNPTITITSNPANDSVCAGNSVTLNGNGGVSYSWNNSVADGVAFTPASSGQYIVTGTDANGCQGTDTVNVVVNPLPVITITGTSPINPGTIDTLTASGTSVSYAWTSGSTSDTTIVSPSATTTYTVTGTGANGCSDTASFTVVVNIITGISNISSGANATIYPNPASTVAYITFNSSVLNSTASIEITDFTGRKLSSTQTNLNSGKTLPLDISNLAQGTYFIRISSGKYTQTIKFVRQ